MSRPAAAPRQGCEQISWRSLLRFLCLLSITNQYRRFRARTATKYHQSVSPMQRPLGGHHSRRKKRPSFPRKRESICTRRIEHPVEAKQLCGCVDENDASRRLVWYPVDQPLHAIAIRDFVLVRHERPIACPYELLRTATLEQRSDVATWIGAALTIRRGELDPGVARAHAVEDCL